MELARHEYEISGMRLEVSSQRQQMALLEHNAKEALEDVATAARICQIFLEECTIQRIKHGTIEALASRTQGELATSYVQLKHTREQEQALRVRALTLLQNMDVFVIRHDSSCHRTPVSA
jgi:hypothetical protein